MDMKFAILDFPSSRESTSFMKRFDNSDLSEDGITSKVKRELEIRWYRDTSTHRGTPGTRDRQDSRQRNEQWSRGSDARRSTPDRHDWDGRRSRYDDSSARYDQRHRSPCRDDSSARCDQRSSSSWEHTPPPHVQSTRNLPPHMQQQVPATARPLSNGCAAASRLWGPGVTPGYFGSGYEVLWWMGLGQCVSPDIYWAGQFC